MTDFKDYSLQNFYSGNFFLPQNDMMLNLSSGFNFWDRDISVFMPSFVPKFDIFNFPFKNFSFPQINFNQSIFSFPTYTQPIVSTCLYPQHQAVQPTASVTQDKMALEPEETDYDISVEDVSKTARAVETARTEKAKTKKAASGLDSSIYVAEEIVPGYYVQKGKYLNTKDLKPYMKEAIVKMDKKAKELGYTLVIVDGFRSHATQAAAKKIKPKLCAPPGKSAHEYGVAVDVALFKNGKQIGDIYKQVPEFGRYAQSLGLEWGATWRTKYEPWHFNFKNWTELADVKNEYRSWNHLA